MEARDHIGTGEDLSEHVTVFVTTVGAPTFDACLQHLRAQDCRASFRLIAGVAPMQAAFQRMLDECRTPYFVQVDEDMLLEPHAVRTLHERIAACDPRVVLYAADLYDEHLERCIIGVKIFRHAVVRRYPLQAIDRFEVRQVEEMEADGYEVVKAPSGGPPVPGRTLGRHGTRYTPAAVYERYFSLERRRTTGGHKLDWLAPYAATFLERFRREPTDENFFALMGLISGQLSGRHGPATAKDHRTYDSLPGFAALRHYLDALAVPTAVAEPLPPVAPAGEPTDTARMAPAGAAATPAHRPGILPSVSVVIPTCRRPALLERALASVRRQTHSPLEIVIVDDAADLPCGQPAVEGVRVLANQRTAGASGARNTGAAAASGRWLAFLDDDDEWLPDYLARVLAQAEDHGADLVLTAFDLRFEDGSERRGKTPPAALHSRDFLTRNPGLIGSNIVIRRDTYLAVGGFDESLAAANDIDLGVRLGLHPGLRYVPVADPLVRHHHHTGERLCMRRGDKMRAGVRRFFELHGWRMSADERGAFNESMRRLWDLDADSDSEAPVA